MVRGLYNFPTCSLCSLRVLMNHSPPPDFPLLSSSGYQRANSDPKFLRRDELRAVPRQLEWFKPDLILKAVCFSHAHSDHSGILPLLARESDAGSAYGPDAHERA
jgi:hypothetical protein